MKLNAVQLRKIEEQFGVEAIPEEEPVTSDLKEVFGDHTFFLDSGSELVERRADQTPETRTGGAVDYCRPRTGRAGPRHLRDARSPDRAPQDHGQRGKLMRQSWVIVAGRNYRSIRTLRRGRWTAAHFGLQHRRLVKATRSMFRLG
jgi:hypothetical protein